MGVSVLQQRENVSIAYSFVVRATGGGWVSFCRKYDPVLIMQAEACPEYLHAR